MNKKKIKTISRGEKARIVTVIGMSISGLALLAAFIAILGLFALEARQEILIAENPGSLMYRYAGYLLYIQIGLAAAATVTSFFFMFHKLWARNLLIKALWGFYLFYVLIGIILVFDSNKSIDFSNMTSLMSFVLPLCMVAFMMRYIYIYLNKLFEKITSDKISGLFK